MTEKEQSFDSKIPKEELERYAGAILSEYAQESDEDLFAVMEEIKKAEPEENVLSLFEGWTHRDRIDLQDTMFWMLSPEQQQAYQEFVKGE